MKKLTAKVLITVVDEHTTEVHRSEESFEVDGDTFEPPHEFTGVRLKVLEVALAGARWDAVDPTEPAAAGTAPEQDWPDGPKLASEQDEPVPETEPRGAAAAPTEHEQETKQLLPDGVPVEAAAADVGTPMEGWTAPLPGTAYAPDVMPRQSVPEPEPEPVKPGRRRRQ